MEPLPEAHGQGHLIPCYKGIDAYDMPKEFARLQAQDLGKVGAMQDLLRGVEKILPKSQQVTVAQEKVVVHTENAAVEPLLKRAFMFLEDCDWKAADEYCEKVLDIDPENAQAYVGKLLAERHVPSLRPLGFITKADTDNKYFQKAMRYGDDAFKAMLMEFVENSHNVWLRISVKSAEEYLSKKSWRLVNSVCTKILNSEPEHAKAQLYQLMASLEVSTLEELSKTKEPLSECTPFQNALRWADDEWKEKLQACLDAQKQFFEEQKAEAERFKQVIIAHQERHLERMISCGDSHVVGLRSDGTILAVGYNEDGQCNVADWRNIATPQSYADFVQKMQAQMAEHKAQREAERKVIAAKINAKTAEINSLQGQRQKQESIYTANAKKLFGEGAKLKKSAWAEMERLKAQIAELEKEIAELRGDKT